MSTPTPAVTAAAGRPAGRGKWPLTERSLVGPVLGVPPQAAVGVAVAFTTLGVVVDVLRIGTVGGVFQVAFFTGCVLAVAWVRHRSLFTPMVAPPLLLAALVPAVVLLVGAPRPGAGVTERLLVIGAPMVNAFPTLAATTAVVLAIGAGRLVVQRPTGPVTGRGRTPDGPVSGSRGSAGARGAAKRPGSPRRW